MLIAVLALVLAAFYLGERLGLGAAAQVWLITPIALGIYVTVIYVAPRLANRSLRRNPPVAWPEEVERYLARQRHREVREEYYARLAAQDPRAEDRRRLKIAALYSGLAAVLALTLALALPVGAAYIGAGQPAGGALSALGVVGAVLAINCLYSLIGLCRTDTRRAEYPQTSGTAAALVMVAGIGALVCIAAVGVLGPGGWA